MQNIKEDVYKCSKCGLCQSVCPLYLATKNEMYLPRGRYIVLNNFFNNGKKLNKKFIENLDICLNCNKCKDFCPSDIDAVKIYTLLKSKYNRWKIPFAFKFYFKLIFSSFKKEKAVIKRFKTTIVPTKEKIVYFQGCINKYVNPSDKNASLNLIEKLGYKVEKISADCCGLPFLSDGMFSDFEKNAEKINKSIPNDVKYIVCSCDSCYETLKKIDKLSDKLIRLDKLLELNVYSIPDKEGVVYHSPLTRKESCYLPYSVKSINKKGSCSVMENFFALKHPDMANQMFDTVFYKKEDVQGKTIITTCQLDKIGLQKGLKRLNSNANLYQYSEYICLLDNNFQDN